MMTFEHGGKVWTVALSEDSACHAHDVEVKLHGETSISVRCHTCKWDVDARDWAAVAVEHERCALPVVLRSN
jgi:hypothetical protein